MGQILFHLVTNEASWSDISKYGQLLSTLFNYFETQEEEYIAPGYEIG